jgi:two-component system OmpR family response regulator/two-component system response regulator QseB
VKPFELDELYARIRAVLRRHAGRAEPLLAAGGVTLDPATRRVQKDGVPVPLSAREFAVLEALLVKPAPCCRGRSSRTASTAGARRSRATRSASTCTSCAGSSAPTSFRNVRGVGYFVDPGA